MLTKPKIPLFIKFNEACAYEEGWALYCERLEIYEILESYYGKLVLEMIRALRLVVDTGSLSAGLIKNHLIITKNIVLTVIYKLIHKF